MNCVKLMCPLDLIEPGNGNPGNHSNQSDLHFTPISDCDRMFWDPSKWLDGNNNSFNNRKCSVRVQ